MASVPRGTEDDHGKPRVPSLNRLFRPLPNAPDGWGDRHRGDGAGVIDLLVAAKQVRDVRSSWPCPEVMAPVWLDGSYPG